jgi:cytochrome c556
LQKAALSGDESLIKKAIGGVGKTCGGCHDDFKAE